MDFFRGTNKTNTRHLDQSRSKMSLETEQIETSMPLNPARVKELAENLAGVTSRIQAVNNSGKNVCKGKHISLVRY